MSTAVTKGLFSAAYALIYGTVAWMLLNLPAVDLKATWPQAVAVCFLLCTVVQSGNSVSGMNEGCRDWERHGAPLWLLYPVWWLATLIVASWCWHGIKPQAEK